MDILKNQSGDVLELRIKGRLDGYWAEHLATEMGDVIRDGARHVRLNMADIAYMSSAGIRVLVQAYKKLKAIQGSFTVSTPSEAVKRILELAGLTQLLVSTEAAKPTVAEAEVKATLVERETARFEVYDLAAAGPLQCRVIGDPARLIGGQFSQEDCRTLTCHDSTVAVGLGAFGVGFEDCQGRFGEFLAVGGAAAYLPTDGTNVPDYMLAVGDYVPDVKVLYGLAGEGSFSKAAYFERKSESDAVTLTDLVGACLDFAKSEAAAIVMVAESSGLMGAALRRSPALEASATAPFGHPEIREWLSFTTERAYARSLALVVGIAARADHAVLAPFIRPIGREAWPAGHFHAAALSYRPLRRGEVDMKSTVTTLFETETLQGLLHLLNDDRDVAGAGQSEFLRGTCWIGPIAEIVDEGLT